MNGKPSPLTIRAVNRVADLVAALARAGLGDEAILRIIRSLAEATFAGRPAVPSPPAPEWGWHDGVWMRNDHAHALELEHAKEPDVPKFGEMFPTKWLAAADLGDEDMIVQVRAISEEKIGMDGDRKWVLWFHGLDKGLVLNKTNSKTICGLLGEDTDLWMEREITLFSTEVDFQGEQVDAIRIRKKLPRPSVARSAATRTPAQERAAAASGSRRPAPPITQQDVDMDEDDLDAPPY